MQFVPRIEEHDLLSFNRRSWCRMFLDGIQRSPWEFLDSLFFLIASIFFMIAASVMVQGDGEENQFSDWMNYLGSISDFLSAFSAVVGFQIAWKRYARIKRIRYSRFLRDFSFYDGLFFTFSALAEIYDIFADLVIYADGERPDSDSITTSITVNGTLMIASLATMTETLIFWKKEQVDIKFTHVSTVMNKQVYAIAPCCTKNSELSDYKIYWLFWSDLFYVIGALAYLVCDVQYLLGDEGLSVTLDMVGQFTASISFLINCVLYFIVFVQAEEDYDDEQIAKTLMDPNRMDI